MDGTKEKDKKLSIKQQKYIDCAMSAKGFPTRTELAKKAKTSISTVSTWFTDPFFCAEYRKAADRVMMKALPAVDRKLKKLVEDGNIKAIKLYYERTAMLRNQIDITTGDGAWPKAMKFELDVDLSQQRPDSGTD